MRLRTVSGARASASRTGPLLPFSPPSVRPIVSSGPSFVGPVVPTDRCNHLRKNRIGDKLSAHRVRQSADAGSPDVPISASGHRSGTSRTASSGTRNRIRCPGRSDRAKVTGTWRRQDRSPSRTVTHAGRTAASIDSIVPDNTLMSCPSSTARMASGWTQHHTGSASQRVSRV